MSVTINLHLDPPVLAHRGASKIAPENTLAAFTNAALLDIHAIEFDVMQAACGEVVVIHDETLERTTNGKGRVCDYPYSYLRTLDAGSWFNSRFSGERIPSLIQILDFLSNHKNMLANVELKAPAGSEDALVKRVLSDMGSFLATENDRVIFSSFSVPALISLRERSTTAAIGLLMHEWLPNWQDICTKLGCVSVNVNHAILTPATARDIKSKGYALMCYTVDDPIRARELYSWGVDAVFSNNPDKIALENACRTVFKI
jgi:glycerophosphoryl diester phosphodiesterase